MKERIKKPYYAFDPNEAHFLFERTIILDSQPELFAKIARIIHRLYFPKYAFMVLAGSIIAFILVCFLFSTFFTLTKALTQVFALIPLVGIVAIIYLIRHYVQIYLEIRSIKKLYKKATWPIECYCAFFEEGICIKSIDMEGVFYWDDFMALGCCNEALVFHFCPAGTESGKFFKQYYPRLDNVYIFINGDEKILELIKLVDEQVGDLVAFT